MLSSATHPVLNSTCSFAIFNSFSFRHTHLLSCSIHFIYLFFLHPLHISHYHFPICCLSSTHSFLMFFFPCLFTLLTLVMHSLPSLPPPIPPFTSSFLLHGLPSLFPLTHLVTLSFQSLALHSPTLVPPSTLAHVPCT